MHWKPCTLLRWEHQRLQWSIARSGMVLGYYDDVWSAIAGWREKVGVRA